MSKITFVGGGSFGTALSIMLAKKGCEVAIWDRDKEVVEDINFNRKNDRYISDLEIPSGVTAYSDMEEAVSNSDVIVLAVPSHVIRSVSRSVSNLLRNEQIVVCIAKGIEDGSFKRLSKVMKEEILNNPIVILSGPSHAEEVAVGIPTTVVVSSHDMNYAKRVQDIFMSESFRVYTNDDMVGVEVGGAVKNIIALAAGILDGIGYGDNAKAALMTRGMSEIIRVGTELGGKQETFYGLTGMGDLIVTCTSMHSRNRRAGILIGQGKTMKEACGEVGMVVEGVKACKAFHELKEKLEVSMPITDMLYRALFENKNPKECIYELMTREKKDEIY
jgi:glycerol-3-phosphate dehydrogenase (NAD(P)+)